MEQLTGSHLPISERTRGERTLKLSTVEAGFIENWGALARSFGMDGVLGRVHALLFLATEPMSVGEVADTLGLDEEVTSEYVASLLRCGALRQLASSDPELEPAFEANTDPWSWFLATLKERGRREFGPLLQGFRDANTRAQQVRSTIPPTARGELQRIERIARFSEFVEQIAGLIETFATLGAGPMITAMRMVAKVRVPRLARI